MMRMVLSVLAAACLLTAGCETTDKSSAATGRAGDPDLRQKLVSHQATQAARRRVVAGWESWNWKTHNAHWEGDTLVMRQALQSPRTVKIDEAQGVRVRKFTDEWFYRVVVHQQEPEPFSFHLRTASLDEAEELLDALLLLGASDSPVAGR